MLIRKTTCSFSSALILFIIFLFPADIFSQEQQKEFLLSDTVFSVGQNFTTRAISFEPATYKLKPESNEMLNVLVYFLKKNPHLIVRIESHLTGGETRNSSDTIAGKRAAVIADYLAEHGIDAQRLSTIGYGDRKVLIKEEEINKLKSEKDRETLMNFNRRIVLTILRTDYK